MPPVSACLSSLSAELSSVISALTAIFIVQSSGSALGHYEMLNPGMVKVPVAAE